MGYIWKSLLLPSSVLLLLLLLTIYLSKPSQFNSSSCPVCETVQPKSVDSNDGQLPVCSPHMKANIDVEMQNLTGADIQPDNEQLLHVLRDYVIHPPSPYMTKMSLRLFQTPQAEVVDKLLKNKVSTVIFIMI